MKTRLRILVATLAALFASVPHVLPQASSVQVPSTATRRLSTASVKLPSQAATLLSASVGLAWDADSKRLDVPPGSTNAVFTFTVTNVDAGEVIIHAVKPSCGCTAAKLPEQPWRLAPGASGPIEITVDLRGKGGTITKPVKVETSAGTKTLTLQVTIPSGGATGNEMDRLRNLQLALADRQALFKGDCSACHVEPAKGKHGRELYSAACAICHEAEHRATMVPDLRVSTHPRDRDYWRQWITGGKPGSLMPAFGTDGGGPLTTGQIASLVEFLARNVGSSTASTNAGSHYRSGPGAPPETNTEH